MGQKQSRPGMGGGSFGLFPLKQIILRALHKLVKILPKAPTRILGTANGSLPIYRGHSQYI